MILVWPRKGVDEGWNAYALATVARRIAAEESFILYFLFLEMKNVTSATYNRFANGLVSQNVLEARLLKHKVVGSRCVFSCLKRRLLLAS